ncbi:oxidation resistance protein 1 [Serendipita sp. 399]|nr:oxidation resistance protein 1 [Serendipita sp. 399]
MYDPFLDEIDEDGILQAPLLPAQSPLPSPITTLQVSNDLARPEPSSRETTFTQNQPRDVIDIDIRNPPIHPIVGQPPISQSTRVPRRPKDLSVVTGPVMVARASEDPLGELLAGTALDPTVRPKPTRKFSTTPLFQPLVPSHTHQASQDSRILAVPVPVSMRGNLTIRDAAAFASVPPSFDPLTSVTPSSPIANQTSTTPKPPPIVNDFTTAAQIRHHENSTRILSEFSRSEALDGDFLGWLDNIEQKGDAGGPDEVERKLKAEEGPPSPPATPVGFIPHTKSPRHPKPKLHEEIDGSNTASTQDSSDPSDNTSNGPISYFPGTLPRRFTSFLANPVALAAQMSTGAHPESPPDPDYQNMDPRAVFALPTNTSVASLSSFPNPLNASGNSPNLPIPNDLLTHRTPFAHTKHVPPTGAPGFAGESGWDTGGFAADWEVDSSKLPPLSGDSGRALHLPRVLRLLGRKEETAGVMTNALGDVLRLQLPALARLCTAWTLLYSIDQHGISLQTFYTNSSSSADSRNKVSGGRKGALLVIRDSFDGVFGAWVAEGIRMNHTGEGHFGGGDSFLWRSNSLIPNPQDETMDDPTPDISVYRWTGRNDYIALCEPDFISLGGGDDGKTGLFLSASLLDGSSTRCITFNNDVLCAEDELGDPATRLNEAVKFEVIGLEVWGLFSS